MATWASAERIIASAVDAFGRIYDASGNGILTLADGTQVPIVDWHVVW